MRQARGLPRLAGFEPIAPDPPGPGKRDWVLLGVLVAIGLLEVAARLERSWTSASLAVGVALLPTVVWRRSRPLLMISIAFGATAAIALARLWTGGDLPTLNTGVFVLLLPYSLFRWGAGREIIMGSTLMLASASLGLLSRQAKVSDVIGGFAVLLSAMALGAAARYRARARSHEIEQVKMREREQLARDLHDTVAHHVSAIAIRAQAGLATAPTNPEAAIDALRVIATEASRTLAEMRAMVRLLRRDESADLAPSPRIADLERLIQRPAEGPEIHVHISGDLDDLSPSVSAAIYRLAQESITNARRHARHATRIDVGVTVDDASVHLRVSDDGDPTHARQPASAGYGLLGMMERAELLGGTCHAGPNPERGWTVAAVLPRRGPTP
ncbi:sensor histidine kinase [Sorangium sp. So ce1153]|uniref:sensor histidine kinase n=1 Tax=Sorangium sp. So ce1153 TaxID=3133333 RepID=UPI003F602F20